MFFDINGNFHFNSDVLDLNVVKDNNGQHELGKVETVIVCSKDNRVLILTRDPSKSDYLYGFDLDGNLIFKVTAPEHYRFWYLSGKQIACNEADEYAKKSPRSGWWFTIDFNDGTMTMGSPAY